MQVSTERTFQLTALLNAWVLSWKEGQWERGAVGRTSPTLLTQLDSCAHPWENCSHPSPGQLCPSHRGQSRPLALAAFTLNQNCLLPADFWQHPTQLTVIRLRVHEDDGHLHPNITGRKSSSVKNAAQHSPTLSPTGSSPYLEVRSPRMLWQQERRDRNEPRQRREVLDSALDMWKTVDNRSGGVGVREQPRNPRRAGQE